MKIKHLFFLLFSLQCHCQNFHSRWYTTDNGLSQNSVKDIVRDKYGFLLLSTDDGVLRYDGNSFYRFEEHNFKNSHFKFFRGDVGLDSILISNQQDKNSFLINRRTAKAGKLSQSLKDDELFDGLRYRKYFKTNLTESITDSLYSINTRTGRYYFSRNLITYVENSTGKRKLIPLVFSITEIKNVFAHEETIFIPTKKAGKVYAIHNGFVQSIEKQDNMYIDGESQIYWSQINNQSFVINKDNIYISEYKNNSLNLKKIVSYQNFAGFQFFCMYYDARYNSLFIGSLSRGLNVITPYQLRSVRKNVKSKSEIIYTLLPFRESNVITQDGYFYDSRAKISKLPFSDGNSPNSMIFDNSQNIICVNKDLLFRYLARSSYLKKEVINIGFRIENIFKSGSRFFLTSNNGERTKLIIYKDARFETVLKVITFNSNINIVGDYNNSSVLVGTNDNLYIMDLRTYKVRSISKNGIGVKNICITRGSLIWILTYSDGIFLLKDGRLVKIRADNEKYLDSPHFVAEDSNGYLWISTNNGLYKVLTNDLLTNLYNKSSSVKYYRYSTKDGLGSNEFNGGGKPSGAVTANRLLVLPSMDGIVFLDPLRIKSYYPQPENIFLERVKINDGVIKNYETTCILPRNYKNATFYIDLPYYSDNDNLIVEARLDDDSTWVKVKERSVNLNGLQSGEHTLIIRVLANGKGHNVYKSIGILVTPHFYETPIFFICCFVSALFLVFAIVQYRTCRLTSIVSKQDKQIDSVQKDLLTAEEKLKFETDYQEHIFQAITHDIATPIKHLSNLSQMMNDTDNAELHKKYFESVYRSTEELYKMTINLREYRSAFNSDPQIEKGITLFDIIEHKIHLFQDLASYNKTSIINNVHEDSAININSNILKIIFQNLLDNAVKNTYSGQIVFESESGPGYINISIKDTGSGMSSDVISYYTQLYNNPTDETNPMATMGLGLHLVIRLVKKIGADIHFLKNEVKGTIIIIKLKTYV